MKTIKVNNLSIQFDLKDSSRDNVVDFINDFNEILKQNFPDQQPQIFTSAIDDADIEDDTDKEETKEEKISKIKSIIENWGAVNSAELQLDHSPCIKSIGNDKDNVSQLVEKFYTDHVEAITYQDENELGEEDIDYEDLSDEIIDEIVEIMENYDVDMDKTMERCKS